MVSMSPAIYLPRLIAVNQKLPEKLHEISVFQILRPDHLCSTPLFSDSKPSSSLTSGNAVTYNLKPNPRFEPVGTQYKLPLQQWI
jgi:hypothetical protein